YTDPKEPEAALRAAVERATRGFTDPALADVLVRETTRVIDWLRAQGGRFMRAGAVAWQNWMMAPPRPLVAGLDWQGRGPDVMLRLLADRLRHGGGTLVLGATARTLVMRDGRCAGVDAEQSGAAPPPARATGCGWRVRPAPPSPRWIASTAICCAAIPW